MATYLPPGGNDDRIRNVLRQAGLDENSPIDPVSYRALLDMIDNGNSTGSADASNDPNGVDSSKLISSLLSQTPSTCATERHKAEFEKLKESLRSQTRGKKSDRDKDATDAAENISTVDHFLPATDERIFRMMEHQSEMMISLHQRMDELTALVQDQQQLNTNHQYGSTRDDINRQMDELFAKVHRFKSAQGDQLFEGSHGEIPGYLHRHVQEHTNSGSPLAPSAFPQPPRRSFLYHQTSKVYLLLQLFLALRRRRAPNFNAGLLVKVIFIVSVLLSRFSHRLKSVESDDETAVWNYRYYLLVLFVVGSFLFSTGLLRVFYIFSYKENYPYRILWKEEEVDDVESEAEAASGRDQGREGGPAQAGHPHPAAGARHGMGGNNDPDNDGNNNNNRAPGDAAGADAPQGGHAGGWGNTFLTGAIEPAPDNNRQNGVVRFALDVGFFVGSFFLSIFPMWTPEAVPRRQPDDVVDDGDTNDGTGLPEYRPPANAMQPADNEDEDDDANEAN